MTRAELEGKVATWLKRGDAETLEAISSMFSFAHKALQRRQNFQCMQANDDIAFVADTDVYPITTSISDFKEPEALYLWNTTLNKAEKFYEKKSIQEVRDRRFRTDPTIINDQWLTTSRQDFIYAIWAGDLHIWPTPTAASIVNKKLMFDYWKFMPVPDLNDTDYFIEHFEDYLLYRTLLESPGFLGNDSRISTWQKLADKAWTEITGDEISRNLRGDDLVMRG